MCLQHETRTVNLHSPPKACTMTKMPGSARGIDNDDWIVLSVAAVVFSVFCMSLTCQYGKWRNMLDRRVYGAQVRGGRKNPHVKVLQLCKRRPQLDIDILRIRLANHENVNRLIFATFPSRLQLKLVTNKCQRGSLYVNCICYCAHF